MTEFTEGRRGEVPHPGARSNSGRTARRHKLGCPKGTRRAGDPAVGAGAPRPRRDPGQPDLGRRCIDGALSRSTRTCPDCGRACAPPAGRATELRSRSGSYVLDASRQDVDAWRFRALRDQARAAAGDWRLRTRGRLARRGGRDSGAASRWTGSMATGWKEPGSGSTRNGSPPRCSGSRAACAWAGTPTWWARSRTLSASSRPTRTCLTFTSARCTASGRKAEALAAYLEAERRSREGYGSDLGTALRDLHGLMLRDDPTLSASAARPVGVPLGSRRPRRRHRRRRAPCRATTPTSPAGRRNLRH